MSGATLTATLAGEWRGRSGTAPCPVCQPERRRDQRGLSIREAAGVLLVYCHKSACDFRTILETVGVTSGVRADDEARKEAERKRASYDAAQTDRARRLWSQGRPIEGTKAEAYLRQRGITGALPPSLRFPPDTLHTPSGRYISAMVSDVQPTGGIHRTFIEKAGGRIAANAKMMLGACAGGAVRLADHGGGPLVICEGIETGLSLLSGLLRAPASVWAALSTSGMKGVLLPAAPSSLIVASDGDEAGRAAAEVLAARADAMGWTVEILAAPDGMDWNDVLQERAAA